MRVCKMNENWSDFEKWVFEHIESIEKRLTIMETRAALIASVVALAVTVCVRFFN